MIMDIVMTVKKAASSKMVIMIKKVIIGVLLILVAFWFWWSMVGNPFHELALIRRGQVTTGYLVDIHEHEEEDYRGHVYLSDVGVYTFQLSGGREFKATTRAPTGQLREQEEIEYLPNNPTISRIKGDGCNSITEWLWRKIGLGGILLLIFLSIGFEFVLQAIKEFKHPQKNFDE